MNTIPPNGSLLTVDQVAERLSVTPAYVRRRLVFEGRMPYVKIGRHLRFDERDLTALIERGRVDGALPDRISSHPGAMNRPQRITKERAWLTSSE